MEEGVVLALRDVAQRGRARLGDGGRRASSATAGCTWRRTDRRDEVRRVSRRPGDRSRPVPRDAKQKSCSSRGRTTRSGSTPMPSGRRGALRRADRERLADLRDGDAARRRARAGRLRILRLARPAYLKWPNPVRPGDALRLRADVLEVRRSEKRPHLGILRWRWRLFNQRELPVLDLEATSLFRLEAS